MARRFHVEAVRTGDLPLDAETAHHAKNVLRLGVGDEVELFDDAGNHGAGLIIEAGERVVIRIDQAHRPTVGTELTIASAIPKGSRADWMIEKLSEIGVARFIPLNTERAVVLPEGSGKRDRWQRLAEEAARQSGRAGVMKIEPLTKLDLVLAEGPGLFGATAPPTVSLVTAMKDMTAPIRLAIGPEGDWSDRELARFAAAGWTAVTLGRTILRVETAALVAAGIVMSMGV